MSQIFAFQPRHTSPPFAFRPVLDGDSYSVVATWNVVRQGWYVNLYDNTGNRIFTLPLIGSPDCLQLVSLSNDAFGSVTAVTSEPHGLVLGSAVRLLIFGAIPSYFNGRWLCAVEDDTTVSFRISPAPASGAAIAAPAGYIKQVVSLTDGYFQSAMQFWASAQEIIVP